jgi:nucleotide-binding universal stress UspA family protein
MYSRVLVVVDATERSAPALAMAAGLAPQRGAVVIVLHVNEYQVGGRGLTVLSARESDQLVDDSVAELNRIGVAAWGLSRRATVFDVWRVVADTARALDAEVVVLPSARRRRADALARAVRRVLPGLAGAAPAARIAALSGRAVLEAPLPLEAPADLSALERSDRPVRAA